MCNQDTDWQVFRSYIEINLEINISLKTPEKLERTTNHLIKTIQEVGLYSTLFLSRSNLFRFISGHRPLSSFSMPLDSELFSLKSNPLSFLNHLTNECSVFFWIFFRRIVAILKCCETISLL